MDNIGFSTAPPGVDPTSSSALLQELETECKYSIDNNPSLGHAMTPSDLPAGFDLAAYADQALNEMQCDLQPHFAAADVAMGSLNVAGFVPQVQPNSSSVPLVRTTLPMPTGSSYIIQKPPPNQTQDVSQYAGIPNTETLLPGDQSYSTSSHSSMSAQGVPEALHVVTPNVTNTMATSNISMATNTLLPSFTNAGFHGNATMTASLDTCTSNPAAMSLMLDNMGLNQQFHSSLSQEASAPTSSMGMVPMATADPVSMVTQTLPSIGSIMTTSAGGSHGNKLPSFKLPVSNINVALPDLTTLNSGSSSAFPSMPVTLKPRPPNPGPVRKTQDLMIYHDKVTGKNFLIPLGPARPSGESTPNVEKLQAAEPKTQAAVGTPTATPTPWNQETYSLTDINVSRFLNIQTSTPTGIESLAEIAASSCSVASDTLSQTSASSSTVELGLAAGKTETPEAGDASDRDKTVETPTSSQESVNVLKSHLLRFIADESHVDATMKNETDPDPVQTDKDDEKQEDTCTASSGDDVDDDGEDEDEDIDEDKVDTSDDAQTHASAGSDLCTETPTITLKTETTRDSDSKPATEDGETTLNEDSLETTETKETEGSEASVPANATPENVAQPATSSRTTVSTSESESESLPPRYAAVMAVVNIQKMSSCGLVPTSDKHDFVVQIDDNQCILEDGKRFWKCLLCPKQYATKHNLTQHILSHTDMKPHSCHVCEKSFRQQSHLHTHMLTHSNIKPYSCSKCGRGFTQASHLKRHMATHMQQRPHVCNVCGRGFAFPSELKLHVDRHRNGQENTCDVCQEKFETPRKLKTHKATAHKDTEPLTCKECGKVYTFPSQLRDHMMKHEGTRPYTCAECGMCFMKEHHLKAHQFTHSGLRPYVCEVCDRAFNQRANLQRHQLVHSMERKYKCEICDKAFTQPQVLKSHMTTHADSKPYKCKYCDKKFARMHNLLGHEATHQGGKPHSCFCGSSFTLKGNLNRHRKVKHGMDVSVDCTEEEAAQILNELSKPRISEQDIQDIDLSKDSPSPSAKKRRKSLPQKKVPVTEQKGDCRIWAMWQGEETSEDETDEDEDGDDDKEGENDEGNISGSDVSDENENCDVTDESEFGTKSAKAGESEEEKSELFVETKSVDEETPTRGRKRKRKSYFTIAPSSAIQRQKECGIFGKTY